MKLLSLYSEPASLFKKVIFHTGFNIIYGKKDCGVGADPKMSLNGIGKSTLLDLIDFCLMCSFNKNQRRLMAARDILSNHKIVLEVEHEGNIFYLKRTVDCPSLVEFGTKESLKEYPIANLKKILANKFFSPTNYGGIFNVGWFRNLILFFLKIQKSQGEKFLDPIKYIKELSVAELNPIHFFLLNLPNELSCNNSPLVTDLKEKENARTEVKNIINKAFNIQNPDESSSELAKFDREIHRLEKAIDAFKLLDNYNDAEVEANNLTKTIKQLLFENFSDKCTLNAYMDSIKIDDNIDISQIEKLYNQFNKLLGTEVKKTLDNTINFRKDLSESRKSFLATEIERISTLIDIKAERIKALDIERSKIYTFLSNKGALSDLTEAYATLSKKKDKKSELSGRICLYDTLNLEITELERESKDIEYNMRLLLQDLKKVNIPDLEEQFSEIYNAIYSDRRDESSFDIIASPKKDCKIEIVVKFPDMGSKGKNQGRTLVYDLLVVLNALKNKRELPSFLIHDGIFDGMDKGHFIALFSFIERFVNESGIDFQYIVTLNEEGTLSEKFGINDTINNEKIEEKAIAIYTPSSKLFGKDFSE